MTNRCIRLTRIHAIQWFGYCDSFDINGNLLVAGRTGAGKSVLMDLIQLVLIGSQRSKFNAASDGRGHSSGRDKKSYCLCDIQQDVEGRHIYARNGGTTYIALEFSWPDGQRVETWGMRVEYPNSEATEPSNEEFFRFPCRLERNDFISPDNFALELDDFRALRKARDGEFFNRVTAYREEMARALNFHRETIDYLLPSAMSFSFLPHFNEFCRAYILQEEEIKIAPVQDSYRNYLRISEELANLEDKARRLKQLLADRQAWEQARLDADVCKFLEVDFQLRDADDEALEKKEALEKILREQEELQGRYNKLSEEYGKITGECETLKNAFRDKGGSILLELGDQIKKLTADIDRLRSVGKNAEEEKERRVTLTVKYLQDAEKFLAIRQSGTLGELRAAVQAFKEARFDTLTLRLRQLALTVSGSLNKLGAAVKNEREQYAAAQGKLEALQKELGALRLNRLMDSPLLDELNRRLPREGRENPARQLRELCEVADEEWRAAIELVMTRKFSVIVSAENYDQALEIYKEFKKDSPGESLVDSRRALERRGGVLENSLARKITAEHPVARAVVDELFGKTICVDSLAELKKYPDAIMRDGFRLRGLFAERQRHYDQRPCIGAEGVKRRAAYLQAAADELGALLRSLQPVLRQVEDLEDFVRQHGLTSQDMEADIAAAGNLDKYLADRAELIAKKNKASTPDLEEQEKLIAALEADIHEWNKTLWAMNAELKSTKYQNADSDWKKASQHQREVKTKHQAALNEYNEKLAADRGLIATRLNELKQEFFDAFQKPAICAAKAGERCRNLEGQLPLMMDKVSEGRKNLVDFHQELRHEPDFDPQTGWNNAYQKLLEKISLDDPKYRRQAADEEQRWQNLFRETVASRLANAISSVDHTLADLNQQLRKPIGDSLYKIDWQPNKTAEFEMFRRVLSACAVASDGESIFASLEAGARREIKEVFGALVNEPDGKLASAFLDYRSYYRYDMLVGNPQKPEEPPKSLNRHAEKFSGGEKQTPFYISILACYLRAYKRHVSRRFTEPSLGLVPIDEAFSKMSGERITDAIRALRDVDLQGILSMSSGNWPYAIDECDQVLAVSQREERAAGGKTIRNIGALLNRREARELMEDWN